MKEKKEYHIKAYKSLSIDRLIEQLADDIREASKIDGKKVTFIKSSEIPFISIDTSMRLSNITKNNRDDETVIRAFDETGKEIYSGQGRT